MMALWDLLGVMGATPIQGGADTPATAGVTKRQSCPSAASASRRLRHTIHVRVRLPRREAHRWITLPPKLRTQVIAMALTSLTTGLDLSKLVSTERKLHRIGVDLEHALYLAGRSNLQLDVDAVTAAVRFIHSLRRASS
jgi:hypothetical protein